VLLKLALLMQNEVNFLILDEPTNHIDIETRELLEEALLDYKGTLLFISHDRYFINKISTRIVHINEKKLLNFSGNF
jgi:ATPase subunit of ABC transporter with duplicated ATPase domains